MVIDETLAEALEAHRPVLQRLAAIEAHLRGRFHDMDEAIRCLMLAALSGEPMLFVGPPGTAKSQLIRSFCALVGVRPDGQETGKGGDAAGDAATGSASETAGQAAGGGRADDAARYFEYLLTPFTEPGELFGHYDIAALHGEGVMRRMDHGMMQHAKIVFLDEVFNASSALLNALLTFMNERMFHDRGMVVPVPLACLVAATNHTPSRDELRAVYDRFLLRCHLDQVVAEPDALGALVGAGWRLTYDDGAAQPPEPDTALLDDLSAMRAGLAAQLSLHESASDAARPFLGNLAYMVDLARQYGAGQMSNRRVVKMVHVMLLHALYRSVVGEPGLPDAPPEGQPIGPTLAKADLLLAPRYFLDEPDAMLQDQMMRLPWPMEAA